MLIGTYTPRRLTDTESVKRHLPFHYYGHTVLDAVGLLLPREPGDSGSCPERDADAWPDLDGGAEPCTIGKPLLAGLEPASTM